MKNKSIARRIALMGILIALEIILTRFISIETPFVRISFTFIVTALMGIFFSPLIAGAGCACADFLGITLFSKSTAPIFLGFTLSAFLTGFLYSVFFYKKEITVKRIILVELIISVGIDIVLNTVWLYMLMGPGVIGALPIRILKTVIMFVIKVPVIYIMTCQSVFKKEVKRWVS